MIIIDVLANFYRYYIFSAFCDDTQRRFLVDTIND